MRTKSVSIFAAMVLVSVAAAQQTAAPASQPAATSQPAAAGAGGGPRVAFELEQDGKPFGTLVFEIDPVRTPLTTANFLRYVDAGYYNGTIIHRIVTGEGARIHVFQGGGYLGLGQTSKPGQHDPVKNEAEAGLKNERGTIAMARDSAPHTATSEFFVNIESNPKLDFPGRDGWGYCAFGRVVEGMDVVDRIRKLETQTNPDPELKGEKSQPLKPPVVKSARRVTGAAAEPASRPQGK